MHHCFCIECETPFLGNDETEVFCPECMGAASDDDYACGRHAQKEKRARNRERGTEILKEHGIAFQSKNDGAHLIVKHDGKIADYWPGTGKFIFREGGEGRGVFNLLRALEVKRNIDVGHPDFDMRVMMEP